VKTGEHSNPLLRLGCWVFPPVRGLWRNGLLIRLPWVRVPPPEPGFPVWFEGFYMKRDVLHAILGRAQDAFRSMGVMSTDMVWVASDDCAAILLLHTASIPREGGMEREPTRIDER
jgi:hypothetical protein